jgi:hypothetical protein
MDEKNILFDTLKSNIRATKLASSYVNRIHYKTHISMLHNKSAVNRPNFNIRTRQRAETVNLMDS